MTPEKVRWAYAQAVELDCAGARAWGLAGPETIAMPSGPVSAATLKMVGLGRRKRKK